MAAKKYYKTVPKWPNITILKNNIDGDIPVTYISSWKKFHDFIASDYFESDEYIYRGQQCYSWEPTPALARLNDIGIIQKEVADKILADFRRATRGRKDPDPILDEDLEMWALGQHHGLKTPLLDWTYSPYVALFFAFEHEDDHINISSDSRILFALNKTAIEEKVNQLVDEGYGVDDLIRIFQPRGDSNKRLLSQAGLFTIVPYDNTIASWIINYFDDLDTPEKLAKVILKIHVPNDGREECMKHLNRMNINHASLFPDLIGSSEHCNFKLTINGYGAK